MLRVLVTPRARRERLGRLADGRIRAFVAAPPGRGKANTRLVRLFARVLRVPEKQVQIVAGTSHVQKLVRVEDIGRRGGEREDSAAAGGPLHPGPQQAAAGGGEAEDPSARRVAFCRTGAGRAAAVFGRAARNRPPRLFGKVFPRQVARRPVRHQHIVLDADPAVGG